MRRWDVFVGSHFLGVVRAESEVAALEAAYVALEQYSRRALIVKECGSQSTGLMALNHGVCVSTPSNLLKCDCGSEIDPAR